MKTGKIIFKWVVGIVMATGLIVLIMPFACMYPFLYIKYSLSPSMTLGIMEKIIKENPENIDDIDDIDDIEQLLNRNRIPLNKNSSDFQDYVKRLERITTRLVEEGKLNSLHINWYHEHQSVHEVKYLASYETRTAWGRTKANLGDLSDKTTYYFLLDGDLRILGWMKEESGQ